MTKRMPRLGATLLAIGLTFATITGGVALSATAAGPAVPDQQVVASFQGIPDAANLNEVAPGGSVYTIDKIPEGAVVALEVAVERVSAPGTFEVIRDDLPQAISGGTTNAIINADTLTGVDLATGDRLRFTYTVDAASTVNYYVIPATGSSSSLAPVVTTTGDFSAAIAFGAGIPVAFSNLDTQKTLTIITSVSRNVSGSFTPQVVISRTYIPASSFPSGTYNANVRAFNELDTDVPLTDGDQVSIEAQSGVCCGSFQGFAFETLVADVVTPPTPGTPAGAFDPAAPTAADFFTGVTYNFTGLDSAVSNTANVYAASAATPTAFTLIGTVPIVSGDIIAGATSITVTAFYDGVVDTPLNEGDVVEVRLAVGSAAEVVTTTYVIPGVNVPVDPTAPVGSFDSASPAAAQFIDGVPYTINNLDSAVTNIVTVYVKGVDGTVFTVLDSATIAPADIVAGDYTFTVTAYYSTDGGVTKTALAAGDTVRIGLATDGGAEVVLTDYVIAAAPAPGGGGTGGGNLAATGAQDDQAVQRDLLLLMGGTLAISFMFMGIRFIRNRKEDALELAAL